MQKFYLKAINFLSKRYIQIEAFMMCLLGILS